MRIALGLSYRGSGYHGWQTQQSSPVLTVQDAVERAITRFVADPAGESMTTVCAGRTDAGVHARMQVVHFESPVKRDDFSWVRGVNTFLPPDVRVLWAREVPPSFHARNSALRRRYQYRLLESPVAPAIEHGLAGWTFLPLDGAAMQQAARQWLGEHDFSSFRSSECQAPSPVKTLYAIEIDHRAPWWVFRFEGSAFLHHMVRNMMGTLLAIGSGRRPVSWASELLQLRDRTHGDPTFMPGGLYLDGIQYPEEFGLNALAWPDMPTLL
jgi:tRNA pseudouridine38-40 synthase